MRKSQLKYGMLLGIAVLFLSSSALAQNPVPIINQPLVPETTAPGGPAFTLTVNGSGFVAASTVNWNGSARSTTFVSGSQLQASITASDISVPGTASVAVTNPAPGGGPSNVAFFNISSRLTSISFSRTDLPIGSGTFPDTVAVADLNGDGKLDIVTVNEDNDTVTVLLGNGDGTFGPAMSYPTGGPSASVAIADFNGDGKLDLAVGNVSTQTVGVLLGNGDGTFGPAQQFYSGRAAFVAAGDFNGDGKLDLVVANGEFNPSVAILIGNGDGTFQFPMVFATGGGSAEYVAVGDFNGDGKLDLATGNLSPDNVSILLGNGDGTFQPHVDYIAGTTPQSLVVADLNGDGRLDLAVGNYGSDSVSVLLGNGDGTFQSHVDFATGESPAWVAVGDFNSDGKIDLVTAGGYPSGLVSVLLGNGDGTFQTHMDFGAGRGVASVAVGDFDGDGRPDLVTSNENDYSVSVLLNSVTGGIPIASVSPASLIFGNQDVGSTSPPQTVTLSNTGAAPLSVSSIGASGDFAETNNCGSSVAAGGSCAINVTFTPTAIGTRTGTLTVTDNSNGVNGSQQMVSLTGTGINPGAMLTPTSLTFGRQVITTTSAAKKVTLTSSGTTNLSLTNIVASGDFAETNNCPASMATGTKCTLEVTFTPTAAGTLTGAITITDNAADSPQSVALTGTGVEPAVLKPTSMVFNNVAEQTVSAAKVATLTNNQSTPLTISSIAASANFGESNNCGGSLAPLSSCTISVTFDPPSVGSFSGTLTVTDNAANSPQAITLSGTSVPQITLNKTSLAFGTFKVGSTSPAKSVTVKNHLITALTVNSITTTGDFAETDTCDGSIPALGTCTINVTFTPTQTGTRTGTLTVNSAAVEGPQTVALTGTGK